MKMLEILGQRLSLLRQEKGLHQRDMAAQLDVTLRHYQRMEHGDVNLSATTLCALADYFGVTTDYLLGRSDQRG